MTAVDVVAEPLRPFFTPRKLAAYLDVSERTVRSMLAKGTIASYLIEGSRRVDPADVDVYLAGRRMVGASTEWAGSACDAPAPARNLGRSHAGQA